MNVSAKWIWLDKNVFPGYEKCPVSTFDCFPEPPEFAIIELKKIYEFDKEIKNINIEISADVKFFMYVNEKYEGMGPVNSGGDFGIHIPMPVRYYNTYSVPVNCRSANLHILVQHLPDVMCDMSQGTNGLIASFSFEFYDGTKFEAVTDETWLARVSKKHILINKYDYKTTELEWCEAKETDVNCTLKKALIPMLHEEEVTPVNYEMVMVGSGESVQKTFYYDKIYSFYHLIEADGSEDYDIVIETFEKDESKQTGTEIVTGSGSIKFRGIRMLSAGGFRLNVINRGSKDVTVKKVSAAFTHYPVDEEGCFECSEPVLNKIYSIGKHALKICRQTIELDSPMHQENLGCPGDYLIASLMNYYTFGDPRLTRLDIVRIGDCLKLFDGYMFHTTYSMMWIMMTYDYYMYTGDKTIFDDVSEALEILLDKMHSYCNEKEIICNPPSYMFVDWLEKDGFSLHHPPMALGQAVLNAFYCGGMQIASKLYNFMGKEHLADKYNERVELLKRSFNECFYDKEKGLYFDGLNDEYEPKYWLPANTNKRYYSWHTNSLAVLYGIAPDNMQKEIMEKILNDYTLINPQPYFMHFVLEAINKSGLFDKYGVSQIMRWKEMSEFDKGLQEGWYDISGYGFDYSHVWAGTPTYQLPSKISGIEILEPGYRKIKVCPNLYGLKYADISVPTPYGYIKIHLKENCEPVVSVPDQITVVQ